MTEKKVTKTDSKGRKKEWIWEETPEVTAATARLHETIHRLEAECSDYGVGK